MSTLISGSIAYDTSKAASNHLIRELAVTFAPKVRVNGVAPGAILWPEQEMDDETKETILSRTTLKRQGNPKEIAEAVAFLANGASYTTGHILTVDGGRSLHC